MLLEPSYKRTKHRITEMVEIYDSLEQEENVNPKILEFLRLLLEEMNEFQTGTFYDVLENHRRYESHDD